LLLLLSQLLHLIFVVFLLLVHVILIITIYLVGLVILLTLLTILFTAIQLSIDELLQLLFWNLKGVRVLFVFFLKVGD